MKTKLLYGLVIFGLFLTACTAEEGEEPNQVVDDTNEDGQTAVDDLDHDADIEKLKTEAHKMATTTLRDLIDTYGYAKDFAEFYANKYETGVIYAELIDFNQDGVDELFVLLKGSSYIPSELAHRETDNYSIEIWGQNGDSYAPFYSRNVKMDNCSACDLSVGLIEFKDGTYGYYESSAQTAQGTSVSEETIHFVSSILEFEKTVFTATQNSNGEKHYKIDGETIAEEAFATQRELYNGNAKPIIESLLGEKSFAFEGDSSAGIIGNLFDKVAYVFDDVSEIGSEVEPSTVQTAAERVVQIENLQLDHPEFAEQAITYAILYEDVEADLPPYEFFSVVSEETIAAKVEEVFGVALDTSNLSFPKPSEDITNHIVAYEDGAFYIVPTDFSRKNVVRTVEKAWAVTDDTYYIVVSDIEFDAMGYYTVAEDGHGDINQFIKKPLEEWSNEARKWAVSDVRRYLVVKMVDGRPTFKYIGSYPLSIEEIQRLSSF